MDDITIKTTKDKFLGGKLEIYQPLDGYRGGIDPVFLAAAVEPKAKNNVLEVGSGTGIALLCLARRIEGIHLTGIEKQKELYELSCKSAELNGLEARTHFIKGDITRLPSGLEPSSFDYVITNPPYHFSNNPSPNASIAVAHAESTAKLVDWLSFCIRMLKPKGTFCMIFNIDRFDEIMARLWGHIGEINITPLWPKEGKNAKRAIIKGRKGVKSPTIINAGLVLHEEDGSFTSKANDILRNGTGLNL